MSEWLFLNLLVCNLKFNWWFFINLLLLFLFWFRLLFGILLLNLLLLNFYFLFILLYFLHLLFHLLHFILYFSFYHRLPTVSFGQSFVWGLRKTLLPCCLSLFLISCINHPRMGSNWINNNLPIWALQLHNFWHCLQTLILGQKHITSQRVEIL